MKNISVFSLFLFSVITFFLITSQQTQAAWQTPTASAPNDAGASTPLNTSATAQTKTGDLLVSGSGGFGAGLGMFGGIFLLGDGSLLNPKFLFDPANSGSPAWGKVLMSNDTSGTATWVATSTLGLGGGSGSNQWITLGSDIYNTGGNVGIGAASSPNTRLRVFSGDIGLDANKLLVAPAGDTQNANIMLRHTGSGNMYITPSNASGFSPVQRHLIIPTGNVGIGLPSPSAWTGSAVDPQAKLEISSDNSQIRLTGATNGANTVIGTSRVDLGGGVYDNYVAIGDWPTGGDKGVRVSTTYSYLRMMPSTSSPPCDANHDGVFQYYRGSSSGSGVQVCMKNGSGGSTTYTWQTLISRP